MTLVKSTKSWFFAVATAGILAFPAGLSAQADGQVTGTVTGTGGMPLSGASVAIPGLGIGALTGPTGRYTITGVPAGAHQVRASLIGYDNPTATVNLGAAQTATLDFQMEARALSLEGVVAVGYGTREQATLTGAVSSVRGEALEKAPTPSMSNAISGRLPGVMTVTESGEPGFDDAEIRIRGSHTLNDNSPLIVIDGVADRSGGLNRLDPQDVESISVLKDASAAIYGSRAANGVIVVTTKRGQAGAPQFTVNFNQGYNQPTRLPEMADAATYMTMVNEIDMYRNRTPRFTAEAIQNHADPNADPWLYPNTDWFAETIKDRSLQSRGNVSVRGGAERVRYFLSLGGQTQDGYYENSAVSYNQYNFRSNVDTDPTENLTLSFDLTGRLENRNQPNRDAGEIFRSVMRGKPNLPGFWPNGLPGPDIEYGDNPVVIGTPATGYDKEDTYFLQGKVGVDYEVRGVPGLTLRSSAAYDQRFEDQKIWRTPWTLYTWDYETRDANGDPVLTPGQRGYSAPELEQRTDVAHDILLNFITEYRHDVGGHSFGLLGGAERQTSEGSYISAFRRYFVSDQLDQLFAGSTIEQEGLGGADIAVRQNYFSRINYDYNGKYLLELVGRYDGSYIFPEDKRFGFFPAVSAGWRISEEPFFQDLVPLLDELKLRVSMGQTGNDRIDEWQYLPAYEFGDGYVFGVNQEVKSISPARTPNPNVTWEVANQFDIGFDGRLLDNRLSFVIDYFREKRSDILQFRNASVPDHTGLQLPRENIGQVSSWGFDGSLSWNQQLASDASFNVSVNGGYNQNRIDFWDETPGAPDYQRSTGAKMNTDLYYNAIGVFKDQAAVDAYPHLSEARPGDIIFEDVNGDGKINNDDRLRINKNEDPVFLGGLTLSAQNSSFDFTLFFQGAAGAVQTVRTESGEIGNFLQSYAEGRWTPDNPSSTKPRAYNRGDEYWIDRANTYFLRNADYIRLKTAEIGYRLPNSLSSTVGLQNMRVYLSGYNILTFDTFKDMDPEGRHGGGRFYPQTRVFNVGTSLTF